MKKITEQESLNKAQKEFRVLQQEIEELKSSTDGAIHLLVVSVFDKLSDFLEGKELALFKKKHNLKYSFGKFRADAEIAKVISALNQSKVFQEEAQSILRYLQNKEFDLKHCIEMEDLKEEEVVAIAKEWREIRVQRRKVKRFIEANAPLRQLAIDNEEFLTKAKDVQSEIHTAFKKLDESVYHVRENQALESVLPRHKSKLDSGQFSLT